MGLDVVLASRELISNPRREDLMHWIKGKLQNEGGLLFLVLAVIGAIAVVVFVVHRI
jgi:hypothetical protein